MPLSVYHKGASGFEGFRAEVALEGGMVAMYSHVYVDVVLPLETLVADVTRERSLGAVG